LLKNGNDRIPCRDCDGEGSLEIRGSLKVCKTCDGRGTVQVKEEAQRVLRQFRQPTDYTVSCSHSVVLKYSYALNRFLNTEGLDIIHALQALNISGIKAEIIYPIL